MLKFLEILYTKVESHSGIDELGHENHPPHSQRSATIARISCTWIHHVASAALGRLTSHVPTAGRGRNRDLEELVY